MSFMTDLLVRYALLIAGHPLGRRQRWGAADADLLASLVLPLLLLLQMAHPLLGHRQAQVAQLLLQAGHASLALSAHRPRHLRLVGALVEAELLPPQRFLLLNLGGQREQPLRLLVVLVHVRVVEAGQLALLLLCQQLFQLLENI
jgi:hypothetical protein